MFSFFVGSFFFLLFFGRIDIVEAAPIDDNGYIEEFFCNCLKFILLFLYILSCLYDTYRDFFGGPKRMFRNGRWYRLKPFWDSSEGEFVMRWVPEEEAETPAPSILHRRINPPPQPSLDYESDDQQ